MMDGKHDALSFFQNIFNLRRSGIANVAGIISNISVKTFFEDSIKVKTTRKHILKSNFYLFLLILKILLISNEKVVMLENLKGCVTSIIYFGSSLGKIHPCQFSSLWDMYNIFSKGGPTLLGSPNQ